jgi:hypothetical protein
MAAGFGELVARLRTQRGLTQQRLAELAGMSVQNIRRGEASERCPWRSSAATDVLMALEGTRQRPTPLTEADYRAYLEYTGLTGLQQAVQEHHAADGFAAVVLGGRQLDTEVSDNPDIQTAIAWVVRLADQLGATRVLNSLEGLAAGVDVDLPPRIRAADLPRSPRWIKVAPQ